MFPCNCSQIYKFPGLVETCKSSTIDFGFKTIAPGIHTLIVYFLESELRISKEFAAGEFLVFPTDGLNEKFEFIARIENPSGVQVGFLQNNILYNCFSFKTGFKFQL